MRIGEITDRAPRRFISELQENVYKVLAELDIPFQRVDTDEAISMEDCIAIGERLGVDIVKTLLLCNRQQTQFYLFVTRGDKPFSTKGFGQALGISRVSFASAEKLYDMLGTPVGGASILSLLSDGGKDVHLVIDNEVMTSEWFGCNDGTPVSYMKMPLDRVTGDFLERTGHKPAFITV